MNVLITGANGFIGNNLVPYLKANNLTIYEVKRNLTHKSENEIEFKNLSTEWMNLKGINAIIHLAGLAHDLRNKTQADEYIKINTDLTVNLYETFLNSHASFFFFMSSVKATADPLDSPLLETDSAQPDSVYGLSKRKAEDHILNKLQALGKMTYIFRPCIIHGPGNKGNLNLLYKIVKKGIPWPLGDFENKRSFCSIENLSYIIKEFLQRKDIPSGIYNIADNETISTNELIALISKSLNRKPRIFKIPKSFIKLIAKSGDILHLPLNKDRLKKLTESYEVSNAKVLKALGKPLPISAKEGLTNTFLSFNTN